MITRRKLVVHVGQTKAGSTSIQNYLDSQREALLENGILFPQTGFARSNPSDQTRTAGHLTLIKGLSSALGNDFTTELQANPKANVVLSSENILFDLPDTILESARRFFSDFDMTIVAVLRPQFDWLRSRYIENVMSGFLNRAQTFPQFVNDAQLRGLLDYDDRLKKVSTLLGAKETRVIPYDTVDGIVPAFLKAADLPVTSPQDAKSIRSNQREKPAFLIEAKRRLNMMSENLRQNEQLELEHSLRQVAREMVDTQIAPDSAFSAHVSLDNAQYAALWYNNKHLAEKDTFLPLGKDGAELRWTPNMHRATEALFWKGMQIAVGIASRRENSQSLSNTPLCFTTPELSALEDILKAHPVSVHMETPHTALLAASAPRTLVRLFLTSAVSSIKMMAKFDSMPLPSPLVALSAKRSEREALLSLLETHTIPFPGVLVARAQVGEAFLKMAMECLQLSALVLVGSKDLPETRVIPDYYRARQVGQLLIVERRLNNQDRDAKTLPDIARAV